MKRSQVVWAGIVVGVFILGLVGCELFDREEAGSPTAPALDVSDTLNATYGKESGTPAAYQPGTMPGIEVVADFTTYHREGQPYGMWIVDAEWRNEPRHAIAEVSVPFIIDDATGIGRAYLPASFLDAVFVDAVSRFHASEDTSTWFHRPGLYLNVIPFEDMDDYYDFGPRVSDDWRGWELSNWSFGDGLEYLVNQLDLRWWPELPPLTNVAALIDIQNPIGIKESECVWVGGRWWCLGGFGESCDDVCAEKGGVIDGCFDWGWGCGDWAGCMARLSALGYPHSGTWPDVTNASCSIRYHLGCVYGEWGPENQRGICNRTLGSAGSHANIRRVCACNQQ